MGSNGCDEDEPVVLESGRIESSLSRVTGGANGRGEQNKSFMNEDKYTPRPSIITMLIGVSECIREMGRLVPMAKFIVSEEEQSGQDNHEECVRSQRRRIDKVGV